MSRRFNLPKELTSSKKQKLEVNINRQNKFSTFRNMESNEQNNLWEDDDDDVILCATQAAEMQQTTIMAPPIATSTQHQPNDLTFSEFGLDLPTTSTQRPVRTEPEKMFQDDDDDDAFNDLALLDNFEIIEPLNVAENAKKKEEELLRIQNAERRLCTADQQMKILVSRMDALKDCNKKLHGELQVSKESMQIKSGEAALLRDELKHLKQEVQRLKMAKMLSEEAAKNKCQTQIEELQRTVEARNAQLQLKSAEFASLKMRHADETKRWEDSFSFTQDHAMEDVDMHGTSSKLNKLEEWKNNRLTIGEEHLNDSNMKYEIEYNFFDENSAEINSSKFVDLMRPPYYRDFKFEKHTIVHEEYVNLQATIGKYLTSPRRFATAEAYEAKIIKSSKIVMLDLWNYVQSLNYKKHDKAYAHFPCELDFKIPNYFYGSEYSLLQPEALRKNERALVFRRYIAALSYACGTFDKLAVKLLTEKHENISLLQILTISIEKLSFSEQICDHFVLLEAVVELLGVLVDKALKEKIEDSKKPFGEDISLSTKTAEALEKLVNEIKVGVPKSMQSRTKLLPEKSLPVFNRKRIDITAFNLEFKPVIKKDEQVEDKETILNLDNLSKKDDGEIKIELSVELPVTSPLYKFELLAEIYKQVAFARPSASVLQRLATVLHTSSLNRMIFVDALCVNSCAESFNYDHKRGVFQFNHKSCVLQVYCNLLVSAFPFNKELDKHGVHLLHDICIKHLRFTIKCFNLKPKFLKKALSAYVDYLDNDASENTAKKEEPKCNCYITLGLSVLKLVHKVVYQWIRTYKQIETAQVQLISQISAKLLHIIFCQNYITRFFRNDSDKTRNMLYSLCKWWKVNAKLLDFGEMDFCFLEKLQKSHIMPKQMHEYINVNNIKEDLANLHILTNGDMDDTSGISITSEEAAKQLRQEYDNPLEFFSFLRRDLPEDEYAQW